MKHQLHKLTALAVSKMTKPGLHNDGGGLYLQIKINGSGHVRRSWIFRYKFQKKADMMGLGPLHTISLSAAREQAALCRKLLFDGINPRVHRDQKRAEDQLEQANQKTFKECATQYIEDNKAGWKNAKHTKQWSATLETYAYGIIGDMVVAQITTHMIVDILLPIWIEKASTANRLRGRIETVLDWAKVMGYRSGDNPAIWKGHLDKILPARSKVKKVVHHPAMPYKEIPEFFTQTKIRDGVSIRALEFAILNASRASEILAATWQEINFEEKLWIIPAHRMKSAREHRIPLTEEAIKLLQSLPGYKIQEDIRKDMYIFPSKQKGKSLSNMSMTTVLRRMNKGEYTQHGFRSSFRDWAAEVVHYPREVIEHALAHKLADEVEAAYQRGDLLEKRRQLMADWANYCYQRINSQ